MLQNYLKIAYRNILRNKTYSTINIAGLAFGLAAFWFIVLFVADEMSFDRYNKNADRIVRVVNHARWNGNDLHQAITSPPFAPALKSAFPEIEDAVRIDPEGGGVISAGDKKIKQGDVIFADGSLPKIFSYDFLFGSKESALGKPGSIILNQTLAEKLFGSAEQAYNKTVYFENGTPNQVTGVIKDIPENSHLRFSAVRSFDSNYEEGWQSFHIYTYLLLKDGVDAKKLAVKLPAFAANTVEKVIKVNDYRMELQALTSIHLHSALEYELGANGSISKVYMFIAIALLIIIIAVINYINLSTARSSARVKEIGVRKVIGSGKQHIAGMFITEAVLVTLIAAALAALIVQLALPLFNQLAEKKLYLLRFGLPVTLVSLVGFSLVTGLIAGAYPSFILSRFKTIPALKGKVGSLTTGILFRKTLVVVQFVITVVMITGSVVIFQQLNYASHKDLGFNKEQVLTFHIDDRSVRNQVPAIKTRLMQSPLVQGAAAAGNPIGNNNLGGNGYYLETEQGEMSASTVMAQELVVDEDYLATMDITLFAGRNFSEKVRSDQYGAALVNETLMQKMGWTNPIGKRLQFRQDTALRERRIVGVVKDFHTYSLQHKIEPMVLLLPPVAAAKDNMYVKLAKGKIPGGLAYVDKVFKEFDRTNQASFDFLDQNFARQYAAEEKQGKIALLFTGLAVLIACLGLFGLATFTAAQRTKEIGLRKVLGASVTRIVGMLSVDFIKLVLIAVFIAFPIAWFTMSKWLEDFQYRIDLNWATFVFAGLAALFVALATISVRAIKAAVANPVKSLRSE